MRQINSPSNSFQRMVILLKKTEGELIVHRQFVGSVFGPMLHLDELSNELIRIQALRCVVRRDQESVRKRSRPRRRLHAP